MRCCVGGGRPPSGSWLRDRKGHELVGSNGDLRLGRLPTRENNRLQANASAHLDDGLCKSETPVSRRVCGDPPFDELENVPTERRGDNGTRFLGRSQGERRGHEPRFELGVIGALAIRAEGADPLNPNLRVRVVTAPARASNSSGPRAPTTARRIAAAIATASSSRRLGERSTTACTTERRASSSSVGAPRAVASSMRRSGTRRASAAAQSHDTSGSRSRPLACAP